MTVPLRHKASGFRSLGEFASAALDTINKSEAQWDGRLQFAPNILTRGSGGAGIVDPAVGGFLVDPIWSKTLVESLYAESPILPLATQLEGAPGA